MGYSKNFIILSKNDLDFCGDGATGYCKIETVNGKSKVTVFAQGLKPLKENWSYKVYLADYDKNKFESVCLGQLRNEGELEAETAFSNANLVIVCAQNKQDPMVSQAPLIGYHNIERTDGWKKEFINSLSQGNTAKKSTTPELHPQKIIEVISKNEQKSSNSSQESYVKYLRQGNLKKVEEMIASLQGVQEYNPFTRAKLKYKWWKVVDIKFFENIFNSSVSSAQIFKHPLIKKMLRNANHCLFGVVSDANNKAVYMAYGFPGRYNMGDQIYVGGFSNFYPVQGHMKKHGDFGYWVVHVRVDNDSIVMAV